MASGLCQGSISSLAAVPGRRRGAKGDGNKEGDVGWGGRGEMCSGRCRRREMGTGGHMGETFRKETLGPGEVPWCVGDSDAAGVRVEMESHR